MRNIHVGNNLPSQVLPAAGAFTAQAATGLSPNGDDAVYMVKVIFRVSYTKGAGATGGVSARVIWQVKDEFDPTVTREVPEEALDRRVLGLSADGFAQLNAYGAEFEGLVLAAAGRREQDFTVDMRPGAVGVKCLLAERGAPATPGTAAVEVYAAVERNS